MMATEFERIASRKNWAPPGGMSLDEWVETLSDSEKKNLADAMIYGGPAQVSDALDMLAILKES